MAIRDRTWLVRNTASFTWGRSGDVQLIGDWDGGGVDYGRAGDVPLVGASADPWPGAAMLDTTVEPNRVVERALQHLRAVGSPASGPCR